MVKKNTLLQDILVEHIGYGGVGVAHDFQGKTILISGGALPGALVDVKVVQQKKDYIKAHIVTVKKTDPSCPLQQPFCDHFFDTVHQQNDAIPGYKIGCGGCKWQTLPYSNQLELKQAIIKDAFGFLSGLDDILLPILPSPMEKAYRNKIEFSFGKYISQKEDVAHHWNLGFHKQGEFSKIVDIDSCGIISSKANTVFAHIKQLAYSSGLPVYDQKTHQGCLRHLVLREGVRTHQLLVHIVIADSYFDQLGMKDATGNITDRRRKLFLETLQSDPLLQEVVSTCVVTYNNSLADVVRTQEAHSHTLWGSGVITEKLCIGDHSLDFLVSPFSFFQTNTYGAEVLFGTAAHMIGKRSGSLLDLYCGTGSIGLTFLAQGIGDNLVGIEIVPEAIQDARTNAQQNNLADKSFFVAGPAEKLLDSRHALYCHTIVEKIQDLGLVVVDPPREGLHPHVVDFLAHLYTQKPYTLLYISCNPITLARDVEALGAHGFAIKKLQPVDMFPHTHHIECIAIIQ